MLERLGDGGKAEDDDILNSTSGAVLTVSFGKEYEGPESSSLIQHSLQSPFSLTAS